MKKIIEINTWWELLLFTIIMLGLCFVEIVFQMWLWKILMVAVFGLPMLSFWQMCLLDVLITTFIGIPKDPFKLNVRGKEVE